MARNNFLKRFQVHAVPTTMKMKNWDRKFFLVRDNETFLNARKNKLELFHAPYENNQGMDESISLKKLSGES